MPDNMTITKNGKELVNPISPKRAKQPEALIKYLYDSLNMRRKLNTAILYKTAKRQALEALKSFHLIFKVLNASKQFYLVPTPDLIYRKVNHLKKFSFNRIGSMIVLSAIVLIFCLN